MTVVHYRHDEGGTVKCGAPQKHVPAWSRNREEVTCPACWRAVAEEAEARAERHRNKACDMRGEIERIRRERNRWRDVAEGKERPRRAVGG